MIPERLKTIILLALTFSAFSPHLAKGWRYEVPKLHTGKQYCFGTRASGMGGAYSSIADDVSGIFYNPAGIAGVQELQAYVETGLKKHRGYAIEGLEEDVLEGKNTFPHYVGVILPVKGVSVGIAHYVPYSFSWETEMEGYDASGFSTGLFKIETESTQEVTSVALAWKSGNEWLLGARLDYCYLKEKDKWGPDFTGKLEADGLTASLGLLHNRNICDSLVSLGLVVGTGAELKGRKKWKVEEEEYKYTIPFELRAGLSCKQGNMTIAGDVVYWRKEASTYREESSTTQFHLGGEYLIYLKGAYQSILPLRWGFYTKPLPYETSLYDFNEHILTFGTGLEFKNISLALSYEGGLGGDAREDLFKASITYKR
ncbi:MAG: hypothetical protein QME81_16770 [bacterium]|nr:hypothetical protein [bacterium]